MSNLQSIITKTKFELKKQETQMNLQLNELKSYIESILDRKNQNYEINENEFASKINSHLEKMKKTLSGLNSELKNEKNSKQINEKILDAIYPISSMITSIKNASSSLILAQNQCALNGDLKNADKLAKISLELNYENHMFVKKASEEIKVLKQNLDM